MSTKQEQHELDSHEVSSTQVAAATNRHNFVSLCSNSSTCLFVYLFTCLFVYLFTCLFVYLFTCLLVYLFTCLLVYLFTCLLVYLFTCRLVYISTPLFDASVYQLFTSCYQFVYQLFASPSALCVWSHSSWMTQTSIPALVAIRYVASVGTELRQTSRDCVPPVDRLVATQFDTYDTI